MIITRPAYQNFHYNGTNFRQSIQDPGSRLRKLIEYVHNTQGPLRYSLKITKHDFYQTIQPKRAFEDRYRHGPQAPKKLGVRDIAPRGAQRSRVLRTGWNQTFWSAIQKAGVIKRHPRNLKDQRGRWYYTHGERWDWWLATYLFFTKDNTTSRWIDDEEDIPEGWTAKPTPITDCGFMDTSDKTSQYRSIGSFVNRPRGKSEKGWAHNR